MEFNVENNYKCIQKIRSLVEELKADDNLHRTGACVKKKCCNGRKYRVEQWK